MAFQCGSDMYSRNLDMTFGNISRWFAACAKSQRFRRRTAPVKNLAAEALHLQLDFNHSSLFRSSKYPVSSLTDRLASSRIPDWLEWLDSMYQGLRSPRSWSTPFLRCSAVAGLPTYRSSSAGLVSSLEQLTINLPSLIMLTFLNIPRRPSSYQPANNRYYQPCLQLRKCQNTLSVHLDSKIPYPKFRQQNFTMIQWSNNPVCCSFIGCDQSIVL